MFYSFQKSVRPNNTFGLGTGAAAANVISHLENLRPARVAMRVEVYYAKTIIYFARVRQSALRGAYTI